MKLTPIMAALLAVNLLTCPASWDPAGLFREKEEAEDIPEDVKKLVELRTQAKKNKDWTSADMYRKQIEDMGYLLTDTPTGPSLQKKV